MKKQKLQRKVLIWLASNRTGISSETMAYTALGLKPYRSSHPSDPADLGRCMNLLDQIPAIREHFDEIAALSPEWGRLIASWGEITGLLEDERRSNGQFAHATYKRMKQLINGKQAA